MRLAPLFFLMPLLIAGCSTGNNKALMVNDRQTLVMGPSVVSAGISVGMPTIVLQGENRRAYATISNSQDRSVTVNYRFYWYDTQGLDILPFSAARAVVIAPGADVTVESLSSNLEARRVRLSLFL